MKLSNAYRGLDGIAALIGVVISFLVIGYEIAIPDRNPNVLIASVLVLIFCSIWLRIRDSPPSLNALSLPTNQTLFLLGGMLFFTFFGCSVLSLHLRTDPYVRPLAYFVFTALMAGMIALEILAATPHKRSFLLILTQTIITGVSLQISQQIIFPSVVGVDPWAHQWFTQQLVQLGHIPPGWGYSRLPLFHLQIASTSLLAGLDYKSAAMLSVGLPEVVIGVLFIFLLGKALLSEKAGLLGALLLVTANSVIWLSFAPIPNTLGFTLTLVGVYLLLKIRHSNVVNHIVVLLLILFALILTHSVSTIIMGVVILSGVLFALIRSTFVRRDLRTYISVTLAAAFIASAFAWWAYVSENVVSGLIKLLQYSQYTLSVTYVISDFSTQGQILSFIGMYSFFALSLVGCFYMISKKRGSGYTALFVAMGLPAVIMTFSNVAGFYLLQERWSAFAELFFALPVAVTLLVLSSYFKRTHTRSLFVFITVFCLSLAMILSPAANVDNRTFTPNLMRGSLTASELQGMKSLTGLSNGMILGDAFYVQSSTYYYNKAQIDVPASNNTARSNGLLLVREDATGRTIDQAVLGDIGRTGAYVNVSWNNPKVYSSGSVDAYNKHF